MKKYVLFATVVLFSNHALALSGISKGGYTACLKKEWLQDVISFVAANDKSSFQSYLNTNKCVVLKKGLHVTVTESPGMFGGKAGFVYQGIKMWTVREAFDYGN